MPASRSTGFAIKLALILFGLGLGLVLSEIALRVLRRPQAGTEFSSLKDLRRAMLQPEALPLPVDAPQDEALRDVTLRSIIVPHPDDKIIFDLRPNLDTVFQRVPLRTNSCGMRGPERAHAKGADTYRIALLGDSFAFGWGVKEEEIFASRLEDNLNRLSKPPLNFEVLNFGVPGYSTFQEVAKFKESGLEFNPDAVLVFFIQNDFGLPFYVRDIYRPGGFLAATEFARLSWKAVDPQIEEQRLELLGYNPNTAMAELADICRDSGIKLFLTFNPRKDWHKERRALWILKKRQDINLIDIRPELIEAIERRDIAHADLTLAHDPHPSALRHALLGDMLTPYFMEIIN